MSDPKMGRKMQPVTAAQIADDLPALLSGTPRKVIARETDSNPYTVKNWETGRNTPSAAQLIRLAQKFPDVRAWLLQMIEPPTDEQLAVDLKDLKRRLAALEKRSAEKA